MDNIDNDYVLSVYNTLGQIISVESVLINAKIIMQVNTLAAGNYVIKLNTSQAVYEGMFIKD